MLKLWTCTDHKSHFVGGASIVLAKTENAARAMLIEQLRACGIPQPKGDFTLVEIDTALPQAIVLHDGNY